MDYFSHVHELVCFCTNINCKIFLITGLKTRHATYSQKLKPHKLQGASFFHSISRNKISVKIQRTVCTDNHVLTDLVSGILQGENIPVMAT